MTSGYSTLVIRLLFLGCLTVYRICVFSNLAYRFPCLSADEAFHVCFFFFPLLVLRGYWRECFHKAMLMNLHVDMSIYGVCLIVVDALDFVPSVLQNNWTFLLRTFSCSVSRIL